MKTKESETARVREWRNKNRERYKNYHKQYYLENKDKIKEYADNHKEQSSKNRHNYYAGS